MKADLPALPLLLAVVVFIGLILQGGRPIPTTGTCDRPCVVVTLPWAGE